MFLLRSFVWLTILVLLLPPSHDGEPGPRESIVQAAYSARALVQDRTGVCERSPAACAASREGWAAFVREVENGADFVSAGLAATQAISSVEANRGTLTADDIRPAWSVAEAGR